LSMTHWCNIWHCWSIHGMMVSICICLDLQWFYNESVWCLSKLPTRTRSWGVFPKIENQNSNTIGQLARQQDIAFYSTVNNKLNFKTFWPNIIKSKPYLRLSSYLLQE
jgi:hypothetical protein